MAAASKIRVMTYNIMHKLEGTRMGKFKYCNPSALDYKTRLGRVSDSIQKHEADVVCLQEVDEDAYGTLTQSLRGSYDPVINLRNSELASNDGCAIFMRQDSNFDVKESVAFRLRDSIPEHCPQSTTVNDGTKRSTYATALWRELHEKLTMAVSVILQPKDNPSPVMVSSTHIFWDPAYPDLKLLQAFLLAKQTNAIASKFGDNIAQILAGDFNSVPYEPPNIHNDTFKSAVYELLSTGIVNPNHPQHPTMLRKTNAVFTGVQPEEMPEFKLASSFKSAMKEYLGNEPAFTNFTSQFKGCLDYIWINDRLIVDSVGELPSEEEVSKYTALPSIVHPSDHLPLRATLSIV